MQQFPELVPSFIDKDEFERDFQTRAEAEELIMLAEDALRKLTDMKTMLDYDNYQDVLAFYRSVRYSASEKIGNAVAVYNDMKQFFPRTGLRQNRNVGKVIQEKSIYSFQAISGSTLDMAFIFYPPQILRLPGSLLF